MLPIGIYDHLCVIFSLRKLISTEMDYLLWTVISSGALAAHGPSPTSVRLERRCPRLFSSVFGSELSGWIMVGQHQHWGFEMRYFFCFGDWTLIRSFTQFLWGGFAVMSELRHSNTHLGREQSSKEGWKHKRIERKWGWLWADEWDDGWMRTMRDNVQVRGGWAGHRP